MPRRRSIPPAFCSVREAADLLGVNPETVRRAYARGELMGRRLGDRVLISRADLLRCDAPDRRQT